MGNDDRGYSPGLQSSQPRTRKGANRTTPSRTPASRYGQTAGTEPAKGAPMCCCCRFTVRLLNRFLF
ncbi:hypothetical protein ANCCAN_07124 [Ancylostoma caninum]|uniref:Uncharacterized protein n=1 Tax=Ancylostoma caninum TaxID=29170 RepID=A0A368GUV8_ANCCA|nr:hypothetical protein ANCCAN_07124 [Ancylostoma caninum]